MLIKIIILNNRLKNNKEADYTQGIFQSIGFKGLIFHLNM